MSKFDDFIGASEAEQLAAIERMDPQDVLTILRATTQSAFEGGPTVELSVLGRIYEVLGPELHTGPDLANVLPAIRAEREKLLFETPEEKDARDAAYAAEEDSLNDQAAAMIAPYLRLPVDRQCKELATKTAHQLNALLSAVIRCIDECEDWEPILMQLEARIRAARRGAYL